MSRIFLLVPVLLGAGVVLADDVTGNERAASAAEAQAQNAQAQKEQAQTAQPQKDQAQNDQAQKEEAAKLLSGMSILGNQEAPKALVIVPWKSSVLGRSIGITPMLDDSRSPVDKEVFMRALMYYEIRSETTRHDGAPAGGRDIGRAESNAAQPATAAHGR